MKQRVKPGSASGSTGSDAKTRNAFSRQVVVAVNRLYTLLYHLPAIRSPGFLQHRAAGGGKAAPRPGSLEAGVSEPELRQRRVPRAAPAQSVDGQQVWRVRRQKHLLSFELGPRIFHVLRQHSGHHNR